MYLLTKLIHYRSVVFLEKDFADGLIFEKRMSGIIPKFTMNVHPGYNNFENLDGGLSWYKMQSKDFMSNISFESENANGSLVSFNGQSITFRISINQIYFL